VRSLRAAYATALLVAALCVAAHADDAALGYAKLRPSLVKVWAFDAQGKPVGSGSGVVIVSNGARSLVLTATHVIADAARITIDVDRERHDIVAHVQQRGPRDLSIVSIDRGDLVPATFAARSHDVVAGNLIAVAGFVEHDELIGVVGQEPRLLYPGTVSSRPDDGAYLELENVHIEAGLSGGAVFDPDTGDVLGIVTSRTADERGGFADSGARVVVPFLASNAIAFSQRSTIVQIAKTPAPRSSPHAVAVVAAFVHVPDVAATLRPVAVPALVVAPTAWKADDLPSNRFAYEHQGCAIVLSLAVSHLAFGVPSASDERAPLARASLSLRVGRHAAPVAACANVPDTSPVVAPYEAAAASYDGRHVTIRFRYAGDAANGNDETLFPDDVSLDADIDRSPVTAHVQLFDIDWDDALDVIAARDS
jgi:hypothetical protein